MFALPPAPPPVDTDIVTIAGLTASTDSFLQAKASAWTTRTPAQVLADLGALGKFPFPATQVPSAGANDLDDYEEGTFTVTASFATAGNSSWSNTTTTGVYTKIGRFVHIYIDFSGTPTIGTASGNFQLLGNPFTPAQNYSGAISNIGANFSWSSRTCVALQASGANVLVVASQSGALSVVLGASNMTTGSAHQVRGTLGYDV